MSYRLSKKADQDLFEIYVFGVERFGPAQADRYHLGLIEAFDLLAGFPWLGRRIDDVDDLTRLHTHAAHAILYRVDAGEVVILRVLHGAQARDPEF